MRPNVYKFVYERDVENLEKLYFQYAQENHGMNMNLTDIFEVDGKMVSLSQVRKSILSDIEERRHFNIAHSSGGPAVGFVCYHRMCGDVVLIEGLYVRPLSRGRYVESALLESIKPFRELFFKRNGLQESRDFLDQVEEVSALDEGDYLMHAKNLKEVKYG